MSSMTNAKEELLAIITTKQLKIKCAQLCFGDPNYKEVNYINLKINYTEKEYQTFLHKIDIEYNSGFGGQELFGIVWLTDDTWLERAEYDGSEWWSHKKLPEIPKKLL